jgi:hypothetical protein
VTSSQQDPYVGWPAAGLPLGAAAQRLCPDLFALWIVAQERWQRAGSPEHPPPPPVALDGWGPSFESASVAKNAIRYDMEKKERAFRTAFQERLANDVANGIASVTGRVGDSLAPPTALTAAFVREAKLLLDEHGLDAGKAKDRIHGKQRTVYEVRVQSAQLGVSSENGSPPPPPISPPSKNQTITKEDTWTLWLDNWIKDQPPPPPRLTEQVALAAAKQQFPKTIGLTLKWVRAWKKRHPGRFVELGHRQ